MTLASLIKRRQSEMKVAKPKQRERLRQRVRVLERLRQIKKEMAA